MVMKLKPRRLFRSGSSKVGGQGNGVCNSTNNGVGEIEWEVRPGGMLVQKREGNKCGDVEIIRVRVSMGSHCHDVSLAATSTFGELKMVLSLVTGLEPRAQRLLFKGKERDDSDHLHMVGVKGADKVLLLEDPAFKEKKLLALARSPCHTAIKV